MSAFALQDSPTIRTLGGPDNHPFSTYTTVTTQDHDLKAPLVTVPINILDDTGFSRNLIPTKSDGLEGYPHISETHHSFSNATSLYGERSTDGAEMDSATPNLAAAVRWTRSKQVPTGFNSNNKPPPYCLPEQLSTLYQDTYVSHFIDSSLPKVGPPSASGQAAIDKFRNVLQTRLGNGGFRAAALMIRSMDGNQNGTLSKNELINGMARLGVEFSDADTRAIMNLVDTDRSGAISVTELLFITQAPMNARREALVRKAYSLIDTNGDQSVTLGEIAALYDASGHPDVLSGKMSVSNAHREFIQQWDKDGDQTVSYEEFKQYYQELGTSIGNDDYFELMIRNAWHISGGVGVCQNTTCRRVLVTHTDGRQTVEEIQNDLGIGPNDLDKMIAKLEEQGIRDIKEIKLSGGKSFAVAAASSGVIGANIAPKHPPSSGISSNRQGTLIRTEESWKPQSEYSSAFASPYEDPRALPQACFQSIGIPLIDKVRRKLYDRSAGGGFRGLTIILRIMDENGNKMLTPDELKAGLHRYHMNLSAQEMQDIVDFFDRDHSGQISITEFLRGIRGPMNSKRRDLVEQAFRILDLNGDRDVTISELLNLYDASQHPDVLQGLSFPGEVMKQFASMWDKDGDRIITLNEFMDYYEDISAGIGNDDYFELMIRNAWHISGGEGWCQNTTCRRVLVTHSDGTQTVEEIKNDLRIKAHDIDKMRENLEAQGITDIIRIELTDGTQAEVMPQSVASKFVPVFKHRPQDTFTVGGDGSYGCANQRKLTSLQKSMLQKSDPQGYAVYVDQDQWGTTNHTFYRSGRIPPITQIPEVLDSHLSLQDTLNSEPDTARRLRILSGVPTKYAQSGYSIQQNPQTIFEPDTSCLNPRKLNRKQAARCRVSDRMKYEGDLRVSIYKGDFREQSRVPMVPHPLMELRKGVTGYTKDQGESMLPHLPAIRPSKLRKRKQHRAAKSTDTPMTHEEYERSPATI